MQYRRILIFTDDPDHERNLARLLLRHRAEVASENMVYQAVTRFKNRPYDLVLLDLDMEEEGEALLDWLVEKYPRRKIIVTGRSVDEELLEHALMQKPVLGYLPKRVQPEELDALMKKSDEGLTGQVQRMHMMDLLQVLRMNQPQRLVIFSEQGTGQQGVLYIQNSEIIHAELYGSVPGRTGQLLHLSGKDAFNRIVRFRNGRFSEKTYVPPEQVTIHEPFDSLVMNASTLMDESNETVDSASIRTILLVDTDPMHRMLVQRTLFAEGFDCTAVRNAKEAMLLLDEAPVDMIITDTLSPDVTPLAFMQWLRAHRPDCPVLVLLAPADQSFEDVVAGGNLTFLRKPVSMNKLKEQLFQLTQVGFRGYLNQISVFDFIQLNLSSTDRKKLHIRDLNTGVDACVYIEGGRFVHAEYLALEGEEAFYKIVAFKNGDFFEDPGFDPPRRTLDHLQPHKLMIQAARYLPAPEPVAPGLDTLFAGAEGVTHLFGEGELGTPFGEGFAAGIDSLFGDDD